MSDIGGVGTTDRTPQNEPDRPGGHGWGHGRSGLVMAAILAGFATYMVVGVAMIEVPEGTDPPGPEFFPLVIAIATYVVAALLVVSYVRTPQVALPATYGEHDEVSEEDRRIAEEAAKVKYATFTDWRSVAWVVGGFVAFAAVLEFAGWVISAALLFWCVARAMGSRRPLLDLTAALTVSSVVYLAFDVLLGLNLPSGFLGGF